MGWWKKATVPEKGNKNRFCLCYFSAASLKHTKRVTEESAHRKIFSLRSTRGDEEKEAHFPDSCFIVQPMYSRADCILRPASESRQEVRSSADLQAGPGG